MCRYRKVLLTRKDKFRVFDEAHTGHVGASLTIAKINAAYYWKGVYEDVQNLVDSCEVCQKRKEMLK